MKQREVTDSEKTRWSCVQAFSMAEPKVSGKAEALVETPGGKVSVVCTPSGGAKTVRLELSEKWENEMDDEALIEAIQNAGT